MKKKLLLMMSCWPMMLAAQNGNGVTVSNLTVNAGSPTTVTFNVSWKTPMPVAPWSDTVWVFVDYNKNGVMERLPVTSATASAGTVTKVPNNDKGVWVAGNARSAESFSATVKLFTAVKDVAGVCAYASNYPPVGEYSSDAPMLSFTGISEYEISLARSDGSNITVKSGDTFYLPCDYTVQSFTDATGVPGLLNGIPFNDNVPRYAASAKTWPIPGAGQIWSDVINVSECDHDAFTSSSTEPYCRSGMVSGTKWFYYNWPYVNKNAATLCPSPWHVPLRDEFIALDKALGGSGTSTGREATWMTAKYINEWGGTFYLGRADGNGFNYTSNTFLWTATSLNDSYAGNMDYSSSAAWPDSSNDPKSSGMIVRCVK